MVLLCRFCLGFYWGWFTCSPFHILTIRIGSPQKNPGGPTKIRLFLGLLSWLNSAMAHMKAKPNRTNKKHRTDWLIYSQNVGQIFFSRPMANDLSIIYSSNTCIHIIIICIAARRIYMLSTPTKIQLKRHQ